MDSQWQGDMLVFDAGAAISLFSEQCCWGQDGRLPALRKEDEVRGGCEDVGRKEAWSVKDKEMDLKKNLNLYTVIFYMILIF